MFWVRVPQAGSGLSLTHHAGDVGVGAEPRGQRRREAGGLPVGGRRCCRWRWRRRSAKTDDEASIGLPAARLVPVGGSGSGSGSGSGCRPRRRSPARTVAPAGQPVLRGDGDPHVPDGGRGEVDGDRVAGRRVEDRGPPGRTGWSKLDAVGAALHAEGLGAGGPGGRRRQLQHHLVDGDGCCRGPPGPTAGRRCSGSPSRSRRCRRSRWTRRTAPLTPLAEAGLPWARLGPPAACATPGVSPTVASPAATMPLINLRLSCLVLIKPSVLRAWPRGGRGPRWPTGDGDSCHEVSGHSEQNSESLPSSFMSRDLRFQMCHWFVNGSITLPAG